MHQGNLSRRGFMQRSLAALTAGAGLPLWFAREVFAAEQEKTAAAKKPVAANDKLAFGAIGIGSPQSRGRQIYKEALNLKRGIQYVAACDVDKNHLENALGMMKRDGSSDPKGYEDFRQLLDNKDVNAVTIAAPDHWHALVAIDALRKGKDVYCEKPLTLTVAEGQALVKVAKETGRIFQTGTQQRTKFGGRFRLACELVRNGRLGKIETIHTRIGSNPTSPPLPKAEIPAGLNWDFWLGPTPKVDYIELKEGGHTYTRCHYEFRWWYEYSGGKMTDWGAHHNDIAQWGLGMDESGPVAVEAEGAAPAKENNRYNCHPTFKVTYTYADGAKVICTHNQMPGSPDPKTSTSKGRDGKERKESHDNGVLFIGEGGKWIFVNRGTIQASDPKLIEEPLPGDAKRLYASVPANHMSNFLDGIQTRKPCICPAEVGFRSVTVCHLGVIALRSGKKLKWDPKTERFDDEEANKMLSRPMRAPWKLEA
jgi:predicted dehydrogenase